jgi:cellulose synthase catalytic subunit (UDP-forming)
MRKTALIAVLGIFLVAVLVLFWQLPTQDSATAAFTSSSSVADYASIYYGELSRPLFPDTSLFLPLLLQVGISCALIFVMVLTALFFPRARRWVMILTTITTLRNLIWRGVETFDFSSPLAILITVVIYSAEVISFFAMAIGYFQVWGQRERQAPDTTKMGRLPSVDIMVCTYGEPISVLYRSLVGCQGIDYPYKEVYLCDDGNRPEMRELAQRVGVHYISRPKNTHAKAGNLNNALEHTNGELILVFDADHVPCKRFLLETVGFFEDDKLGFVQTPQHFFTDDPFQRNLVARSQINNEQDLFFHVIQPGNDYWDSAFFAGSGALFRRSALESVHGFAVETITEDVHTGMRIHGEGWKSIYYNRDLAAGMAQDSFVDVIKQRLRWARGMTQIYCLENPLFAKGLSMAQRICYFTGIWYFFHGLPRLIFLVAPLFFLLFGYKTINSGYVEVLIYYLPSFLATALGYTIITRGVRHSFWSEVYETAFCVYLSLTTFLTFLSPKRAKFRVTPKGGLMDQLNFNWRIVFPQVLVTALTILGIGMAITRAVYTPDYAGGIYTNMAWSIYNLILLLGSIYVAQDRPQFRLAPRISRRIRCELKLIDNSIAVGYTTNVSESGMALVFDEPIPVSGAMLLKIMDWDINETSIMTVEMVRSVIDDNNRHHIGFRVVNRTEEQHRKLVLHMFGSAEIWLDDYVYSDTHKSFWNLITTPFRMLAHSEEALRRGAPRFQATLSCMLTLDDRQLPGSSQEVSESGISVLLDKDDANALSTGQAVGLHIQWPSGHVSEMTATVQRLESGGQGRRIAGLAYTHMTAAKHVEIVQQIYRPKERLVRAAPSVSRVLPCTLTPAEVPEGEEVTPISGMTQEISELGAIIHIRGRSSLNAGDKIWIDWSWDGRENVRYPGEVVETTFYNGSPVAMVYFVGLNMKTLDQISHYLHEPLPQRSFESLIGE